MEPERERETGETGEEKPVPVLELTVIWDTFYSLKFKSGL